MTTPVRIRLSRRKGFRLQAMSLAINGLPAVKVDRSTGYGNAWSIRQNERGNWYVDGPGTPIGGVFCGNEQGARLKAVDLHRWEAARLGISSALAGNNLACWCALCPKHARGKPLDVACDNCAPCHADTLIRLANHRPLCEPVFTGRTTP